MNNLILQKLLHGHQLIQPNASDKNQVKFGRTFLPAPNYKQTEGLKKVDNPVEAHIQYYGYTRDMSFDYAYQKNFSGNISLLPRDIVYSEQKLFAQQVSQAAKFYLDICEDDGLTEKEHNTIEKELLYYLPYKSVFLQVETEHTINNILIHDHNEDYQEALAEYKLDHTPSFFRRIFGRSKTLPEGVSDIFDDRESVSGCFSFQMLIWDKANKHFVWDLNQYTIYFGHNATRLEDGSFYYKIQLADSPLTKYLIGDNEHLKVNGELSRTFIMEIINRFRYFMIALQHPTIIDAKDVEGRQNVFIDTPTKFTTTALSSKPKFAHKNLKINLYGNQSTKDGSSGSCRSSGTAFHSVRKHMRKLANGRHTFVRAHFRGSKEVGVITKDYEFNQK